MTRSAPKDFAALILTHGRPRSVVTHNTLRACGYTGPIYLVVDDEDAALAEYQKTYGKQVVTFSKKAVAGTFDIGDSLTEQHVVVFARNAVFDLAEDLGLEHFVVLDDDYPTFAYKFNDRLEYQEKKILNLDAVFALMLAYYKNIPGLLSLAMAQNGDFIGGGESGYGKKITAYRKAMNTFFCSTKRRFSFVGRINEDVNAYVLHGTRGGLFLTIPNVAIHQTQTQANPGGLTEFYLDYGTFVKSFYTVMYAPSCTTIGMMGDTHKRLHHNIAWNNCCPKILSGSFARTSRKKKSARGKTA